MTRARLAVGCLALAAALSACSGYRSGPAIYSRVSVESPWTEYPGGDTKETSSVDRAQDGLPPMGMPDTPGFGYDDF